MDKEKMGWLPLDEGEVVCVPSVLTDGEQVRVGQYSIASDCWIVPGWIGPLKPTHYITVPELPKSERKRLAEEYKKQHDVIRDEFEKLAIRQGELIDQKTKLMDEVDKSFPQREGNRSIIEPTRHVGYHLPIA